MPIQALGDYALLFVGLLVVGMPVLLYSMHFAVQGELDPWVLAALALAATLLSDSLWYGVGLALGRHRERCPAFLARRLEQARTLGERFSLGQLLFLARFLYGTRIAVNALCGVAGLRYRTHMLINVVSAFVWLGALFLTAYSVSTTLEHFLAEGQRTRALLALLAALALAWSWLSRRMAKRARAGAALAAERPAPAISVVIPACNEESYIEEAIRSVRRQTLAAEVIVMENGSTDGTRAIAERLADRVIHTAEQQGYSRARNLGAAAAKGSLLVFLDADSTMAPDALSKICARIAPSGFGTVRGRPSPSLWRYEIFMALKNGWQRLQLYRGVLGGLLFCDAEIFRRCGGFDESLAIDELRAFVHAARAAGGRYQVIASTYASTSMRRFESVGLLRSLWFWLRLRLGVESGAQYVLVRHAAAAASRRPAPAREGLAVRRRARLASPASEDLV